MKASHLLKLKTLETTPKFTFQGNQIGIEPFELWPMYNLHCKGHRLDQSTIAFETIKREGL